MKKFIKILLVGAIFFMFTTTAAFAKINPKIYNKCKIYKKLRKTKTYNRCVKHYTKVYKKRKNRKKVYKRTKKKVLTSPKKYGFYAGGNFAIVKQGDLTREDEINEHEPLPFKIYAGISALGGYKFNNNRVELEYFTHKNKADIDNSGTLYFDSLLVSFYHRANKSKLSPILGLGVGGSRVENGFSDYSTTAYHISAGIDGQIDPKLSWNAMVRVMKYNDFDVNDDNTVDVTWSFDPTIAVVAGVKYFF